MARQLKNSDSSSTPFGIKYGTGADGDKTYSSNHTLDSSDKFYNSRCTGTSGATTGSTPDLADGTYNLVCKIVQSQGTGANATPNWEYNKLISVSGGVATFLYPFSKTWNTGAQIITSANWRNVVINNGIQLTVPAWNGSYGGEFFMAANVSITGQSNNGQIVMDGLGFRAGSGANNNGTGQQGEGYAGVGSNTNSANGNGAGGAQGATDGGHVEGGNSGGGSNYTSGTSGSTRNTGIGGVTGNTVSTIDCQNMTMGGASSGAGGNWSNGTPASSGVNGSGNAHLLAPTITGIVFYCRGLNGNSNSSLAASGASAGGCALCQGQNISNITFNTGGGIGGTCTASFGGTGGNGGNGTAQIDYSGATPTSITGSYNSTLTPVLASSGGGVLAMI